MLYGWCPGRTGLQWTESLRDLMTFLTIRHVTTYRYRRPVAFGEHRLMFRPRDSDRQKVRAVHLAITPLPADLDFIDDEFGNQIAVVRFSASAEQLRFECVVHVERPPQSGPGFDRARAGMFPVTYDETTRRELTSSIGRRHADPDDLVGAWASGFLPNDSAIGNFELLVAMTEGIRLGMRYQRREEKGIQGPGETLRRRQGSCRDFALLLVEAARSLGFAARFASGYLGASMDDPAGGATHAWAQVYLPIAGWVDFDPTSGTAGAANLVTVAVVADPSQALPLHGTYFGAAGDHLGMDVHVRVIDRVDDPVTEGNR